MCDREGECGTAGHPPAGAQIGQLDPQHLHNHLVVQGQVEVMLVGELKVRTGQVKGPPFTYSHTTPVTQGSADPEPAVQKDVWYWPQSGGPFL